MSLKEDYTKVQLKEMSLLEVAYELLNEKKQAVPFNELMAEIVSLLGLKKAEANEKMVQFYTDLNIDGRFLCLGDNRWGIRLWYPVDQAEEETVTVIKPRKKKAKKKAAKKVVVDDFDDVEEEEDEELDFDDLDDFDEDDDDDDLLPDDDDDDEDDDDDLDEDDDLLISDDEEEIELDEEDLDEDDDLEEDELDKDK